ncbi:MAG: 4-hydroxybenzoate octaprenyltransferase, partial [Firmicutes bacterium]|nr:4-hydroxybenzoate octaprenyltransferase [Bacillota bacterium]
MVFRRVRIFLEMIKFEHSVFALPFAYIGALLVGRRVPSAHD